LFFFEYNALATLLEAFLNIVCRQTDRQTYTDTKALFTPAAHVCAGYNSLLQELVCLALVM